MSRKVVIRLTANIEGYVEPIRRLQQIYLIPPKTEQEGRDAC